MMTSRVCTALATLSVVAFAGCDSDGSSGDLCLAVTPNETYTVSGEAMSLTFTPAAKTYAVRNTCSEEVMLVVSEDKRWLDVEIAAFGGVDESGAIAAGASIDVDIELRYGSDDPDRLNQLAPGSYSASIHFDDDTNDTRVTRSVELTVNAP